MAPKVIEKDIFEYPKEINKEVIEKLIVKGRPGHQRDG